MVEKVYVERGAKRVFACALDWPGWCRSGRTEEAAISALAAYAPRYSAAVGAAVSPLLEVVDRVPGGSGTDFGVPSAVPAADLRPVGADEATRLAGLVAAAWAALDRVVAGAPAELRKGPRGGGRDRDKIVDHVTGAEAAYAPKLGVPGRLEPAARRAALLEVIGAPSDGRPPGGKGWPVRYAARRIAWHALDHAWEIEDRILP